MAVNGALNRAPTGVQRNERTGIDRPAKKANLFTMIQNLRCLLILLLIVALPWPGTAMMAAGSAVAKAEQAVESPLCHDLVNHFTTAAESETGPLPHPESCAATHAGKCCVSCQAHSLPAVLPHVFPRSGFTPYPPPAERWSGFIPDLLHRPPR